MFLARQEGNMRGYISSIEITTKGEATLTIDVDFTDHEYDMKLHMMEREPRMRRGSRRSIRLT